MTRNQTKKTVVARESTKKFRQPTNRDPAENIFLNLNPRYRTKKPGECMVPNCHAMAKNGIRLLYVKPEKMEKAHKAAHNKAFVKKNGYPIVSMSNVQLCERHIQRKYETKRELGPELFSYLREIRTGGYEFFGTEHAI